MNIIDAFNNNIISVGDYYKLKTRVKNNNFLEIIRIDIEPFCNKGYTLVHRNNFIVQIEKWLAENINGKYLTMPSYLEDNIFYFLFEKTEDAMLFKLRWESK